VRFPPNAGTSERDREAKILLLASDVADIPTEHLLKACIEWVRTKAFMPKASELIALSADMRIAANAGKPKKQGKEYWQEVADKNNADLADRLARGVEHTRDDIVWLASESACYLDWKRPGYGQ
jgi:hypothetical protein